VENQLVKVINESGLDKTKAQVLLENFANYFEIAADWENKAKALTITSVEQRAEMKMAREGRLFLKEKRVAVEKTRKSLKENALREGQTIDAIAKILTNLILPIEENLEQKEKYAEIKEAERKAQLKTQREMELQPYIEFVPEGVDLAVIDEINYTKVLDGAKLQYQAKIDAEAKVEAERIAKEKAVQLHNERKEQILPYWNYIPLGKRSEDFSTFTEQEWKERLDWCVSEKKKEDEQKELQRKENERLKAEAEAKEKQLAIERQVAADKLKAEHDRAEKERAALAEKARKEQEASEAKLKAEQEKARKERELAEQASRKAAEEKAILEAEIKANADAEEKARKEQREREETERKAKELTEKKAKAAPDKDKLLVFAKQIDDTIYPDVSSEGAIKLNGDVKQLLAKVTTFIREKVNQL